MSENEIMLLKKAIDGDTEAFELLISRHQKYIYNIALKYMKDPDDAYDISQEVLIKIFKNIEKFNMNSKFSTWIYRIAVNTCKDALRKKKEDVISINDEKSYVDAVEDNREAPERKLYKKEINQSIANALDELSVTYKEAIVLCDINGFSYQEIANILEIPVGTVRSRINRGRKKLRKILENTELLRKYRV